MMAACPIWKDQLLEAALGDAPADELAEHLKSCPGCAGALTDLSARRERLDRALPLVARGAELPADFRARVLAAAEANEPRWGWWRRGWVLAGAAVITASILVAILVHRHSVSSAQDLDAAAMEKMTHWRAPSDVFLETLGRENLRMTPRLGDSIVNLPVPRNQED
jgi:anti-sigma factor RsiW